ncbi:MAG TPA: extracellular solute-binding protein [Spirochaetia bacterium]|nr:extracellular solute-binding protein [Spirochaetales bacterium]HRY72502.1 extracellular solute-binding protein [Spirochaetia bacterium]
MKRILAIGLALLAAAALFVSCGAKGSNELVIQSNASDQAPKDQLQILADQFMKENPGIKVTINTTAHEQFKTQLMNYLTAKDAPDVLTWFAGYRMQQYAAKGLLEPLDSIWQDSEFPAAFKTASSYNGKTYFMPSSWYWWAVYYNKDVFAKLNLSVPKTWEEFEAVCAALKKAGIEPIAIGAKDTWTAGGWFDYMNVAVNGGALHQDLTAGKVSYTDPKVANTFNYIADLSKKGYFMKNAASYSWQEAATVMFDGKAGMYLMGQFIKDVAPADKKDKIDWFQFPIVGNNTAYGVDTPIDGYFVPAKAKNKANALKFAAFLQRKDVQESYCKALGRLAANQNVAPPNADAQRGLDMVKGAATAMQFYDRDAPEEMAAKGMNAIVDIIGTPDKAGDILAALDKERERIYAELK